MFIDFLAHLILMTAITGITLIDRDPQIRRKLREKIKTRGRDSLNAYEREEAVRLSIIK